MAVTITVAEFIRDARIGATAEELALATDRLAYATQAVLQHAPNAPDVVHNEAVTRLAAYLYDQPTLAGGAAYGNAMRNSGAGRILLPYRVHGLGVADTVAEVNQVVGTVGNPVTGLSITGDVLTITFADQTTGELTLPDGSGAMFSGVDDTARAAAAAAQDTADANTANVATNTDAIAALPTPVDWAQEGNPDLIPSAKINSSIRGTKVHVSTSLPATGLLGDIVILDLTTTSPSIYEWTSVGWQLDYTFRGGRVHVVTAAHDIATRSPTANGGDILFELVGGTLKMYRRLNANNAPFWQYYGEVTGGGGGDQIARDAAAAASAAVTLLQTSTTDHYADPNAHHVPPTGGGGPAKLGNWNGDLVADTWTATTIAWPTTALVGIAAVHTITFDNVTSAGWPIGWYDSAAAEARRYNFRVATGAAIVWIRRAANVIELRVDQNRDDLSFDLWSL